MRMMDVIQAKRDGHSLTDEQIRFAIQGYTDGNIPDYQMAALAMAIYFQGMDDREIADLTMAMARSGDTVDLSAISGIKVDKHSTGGVGDKTSLIVVPLVAAAGVPVAKMSGRGLGHTGGTVDKLESIPGFRIELTPLQFIDNVNRIKLALVGQSGNLAPADKKLYALRDVTATVNSIPLIASSIMSKKIASGADAIVLDVKVGSGAFMKTVDDARKLAATMVAIGKNVGRRTIAVLSDMNEPLGVEIGNANEVQEAIDVLKGRGERKLTDICLTLASYMTVAGGVYPDIRTARPELERMLQSGQAVDTLRRFIEAQGGDPRIVEEPSRLPQPSRHMEVTAQQAGYVTYIDAEQAGIAAMLLGAGRQTKEEAIDYAVGITLKAKVGAYVQAGEPIAELHYNERSPEASAKLIREAVVVGTEKPEDRPVVLDVME